MSGRTQDWRRHYHAQVSVTVWPAKNGRCLRHLRVVRLSGNDGIGWDVLQQIKNEMFGPEVLAVEVYPPEDRVVNNSNMRHLWEVPIDLIERIPSL
jgi:hypothetical protein